MLKHPFNALLVGFLLGLMFSNILLVRWRPVVQRHYKDVPLNRLDEKIDSHTSRLTALEAKGTSQQASMTAEAAPSGMRSKSLNDSTQHQHDDTRVARKLQKEVRVLCWIMTSSETLETRARYVQNTWGKRCNILLFASDKEDKNFPTISVETARGRAHLLDRTVKTFDYVYAHHFNDADWFMKADDDTYVIMENLRYFLSEQTTSEPVMFGQHFWPTEYKKYAPTGYTSGGAGYIISKEALARFGRRNATSNTCLTDGDPEDLFFGQCMHSLGVRIGDTRDALNRSRFHCFSMEHMVGRKFPDWYFEFDTHGNSKGGEDMSDYAISFHYILGHQMYDMEQYVYHLRPYGILSGLQRLNKPAQSRMK